MDLVSIIQNLFILAMVQLLPMPLLMPLSPTAILILMQLSPTTLLILMQLSPTTLPILSQCLPTIT